MSTMALSLAKVNYRYSGTSYISSYMPFGHNHWEIQDSSDREGDRCPK